MWGLEFLAIVEIAVLPTLMMFAGLLVAYDASFGNPEMTSFVHRQVGVFRHLVIERLPKSVRAYIPEMIKGPEEIEIKEEKSKAEEKIEEKDITDAMTEKNATDAKA